MFEGEAWNQLSAPKAAKSRSVQLSALFWPRFRSVGVTFSRRAVQDPFGAGELAALTGLLFGDERVCAPFAFN